LRLQRHCGPNLPGLFNLWQHCRGSNFASINKFVLGSNKIQEKQLKSELINNSMIYKEVPEKKIIRERERERRILHMFQSLDKIKCHHYKPTQVNEVTVQN